MADAARPDRSRGSVLQFAGAQAMLLGGFTSFLGLGFFRLAGLIFGGAALFVLGAGAATVGTRQRSHEARRSHSGMHPRHPHRAFLVSLVVLGAAMAVYGAASLTGGWLGTPPWWERPRTEPELEKAGWGETEMGPVWHTSIELQCPREGRTWISGGVVAAGLAIVAVGAWPRRRESPPAAA